MCVLSCDVTIVKLLLTLRCSVSMCVCVYMCVKWAGVEMIISLDQPLSVWREAKRG